MRILLIDHDHDLNQQKAIARCYPNTHHQRCWVHKTANILFALPKPVQPKVKAALHEIWMAETRDEAHKALDRALVYKLLEAAHKNRRRIKGFDLLTFVVNNVTFKDGDARHLSSSRPGRWLLDGDHANGSAGDTTRRLESEPGLS